MTSSESDDFDAFLDSLRPKKEKEKYRMSSGSLNEFIVDNDHVSFCDSSTGGSPIDSHERNIDLGVDGIRNSFLNLDLSPENASSSGSLEDPGCNSGKRRSSSSSCDSPTGKMAYPSAGKMGCSPVSSRKSSSSSCMNSPSPGHNGIRNLKTSSQTLGASSHDASSPHGRGDGDVACEHPSRKTSSEDDNSSDFLPEHRDSSNEDQALNTTKTSNPRNTKMKVSAIKEVGKDGWKLSTNKDPNPNSKSAKTKRLNELRNRGSFTPRQSTASAKKKSLATPVIVFSSDDDGDDEDVFLPPRKPKSVPKSSSLKENIAPPECSANHPDSSITPPVHNTPTESSPRSMKKSSQILVFSDESDSDSDNDVVYLGDVPGSSGQKASGTCSTRVTTPSELLTGPRGNDSDDGYTPLLSRITGNPGSALRDLQNRDTKKDEKPSREPRSSLPLHSTITPVKKPPKACFTDKATHTKPASKKSDGLPPGLPLSCEKGAAFKKHRETITRMLYDYHNKTVFGDSLPADMVVEWNKRLLKTAGVTKCSSRVTTKYEDGIKCVSRTYNASISLSEKVLDNLHRLRDTLCHEMCHAAVWLIDHQNEGHGVYWKSWARKAMVAHPGMPVVRRCHSYDIAYKFSYQCTVCRKIYGRHSKSINVDKQACGLCRGKLVLLPPKKSDGTLARSRQPNKFAMFVKENYKEVQSAVAVGRSTPNHADVMKALSKKFASLSTNKQ